MLIIARYAADTYTDFAICEAPNYREGADKC
jgi:hypothetical protein